MGDVEFHKLKSQVESVGNSGMKKRARHSGEG